MKIVCTHSFIKSDLVYLKKNVPNGEFIIPSNYTDSGIMDACHKGVDIFLGPPPGKKILKKVFSKLKFIQIPWSGVDNIDFSYCKKLNIKCLNSHSNSVGVAELGLGLLFCLLKKIPFHDRELKKGKWHKPNDPEGFFPPILLEGKTVGYFGFGKINQQIHRMLKGFKIKNIACVKSKKKRNIKSYNFSNVAKFMSLCDIIIISAPLTHHTINLFDEFLLKKIRNNGYIINLSRAEIINENALIKGLNNNIAGAAFDNWYDYPARGKSRRYPCAKKLLKNKNFICSPHRGGYVKGKLPHLEDVIKNLNNYKNKHKYISVINLTNGY